MCLGLCQAKLGTGGTRRGKSTEKLGGPERHTPWNRCEPPPKAGAALRLEEGPELLLQRKFILRCTQGGRWITIHPSIHPIIQQRRAGFLLCALCPAP